jgi:DegV family protein with EDD domain
MKIVTDSGSDLLMRDVLEYDVRVVSLPVIFNGRTYKNLPAIEFYEMLASTGQYPSTAAPSPQDFADAYREVAKTDTEILSIHLSSGLSATLESARLGATMVPEANVHFIDSKVVSIPLAMQIGLAGKAIKKGLSVEKITELCQKLNEHMETYFTLDEMRYLIHGGRVSHLKGTLAAMLNINPILALDVEHGTLKTLGQARTMKKTLATIVDKIEAQFGQYEKLLVQFVYGDNLKAVEMLKGMVAERFNVEYLPTVAIATVLGAHTGPSVVGIGVSQYGFVDELIANA